MRIPFGIPVLIVLTFGAAQTTDAQSPTAESVGIDLLLKGRVQDAREHLVWVRDYGNKRFMEYALALAELGRM